MTPNSAFYVRTMPGVVVTMVTHPTEMDKTGRDGLYVQSVYVEQVQFQVYCNMLAIPWYKFSDN